VGSSPLRGLLTARAIRTQALVVAALSWTFGVLVVSQNTGKPLGLDFVQFYTMGALALTGSSGLYDQTAFSAAQEHLVPASSGAIYHPVYPPQVALIFSPFALLPYEIASVLWTCLTVLGYFAIVAFVWRRFRHELSDGALVVAAAVVFPPLWHVVLFGQNSVLILLLYFLGWRALESRQSFLAGAVFGLLAIKPQFAIPIVVIALTGREWAMVCGAAVSLAVQVLAVVAVFGSSVLGDYVHQAAVVVSTANQLEPLLYKSLSLRSLTRLVPSAFGAPPWLAFMAWLAFILLVLAGTARSWICAAPLHARVGVVALAAVLVSPHLIIYDTLLLALPLLWCGAWVEAGGGPPRRHFWFVVYGLFVALWLIMAATLVVGPAGGIVFMVITVLLLVWIFSIIVQSARRTVAHAERASVP